MVAGLSAERARGRRREEGGLARSHKRGGGLLPLGVEAPSEW